MLLNRRFTSAAQGVTLIVKCSLVLQPGNGPKLRATECWNSTNPLDYFVLAQQGRVGFLKLTLFFFFFDK